MSIYTIAQPKAPVTPIKMKALTLNGTWAPRAGYQVNAAERETAKAIRASAVWKLPKLELIDRPVLRIEDDEVLIRVRTCGICGTDTHCFEADEEGYVRFSGPARLPVTFGHEFSGEVIEIGKKVIGLKIGEPVACESINWCGTCTSCRSGNPNQCDRIELLGLTMPGALAEYVAVNQRFCWSLETLRDAFPSEKQMYELGAL